MTLKPADLPAIEVGSSTLAALWGLSAARVRQLVTEGVIARSAPRRYRLLDCCRAYAEHQRARSVTADATGTTYDRERTRLAKARADAQELSLAERRGSLIPQAEVEIMLVGLASATQQRLLGVPSKIAPLVHASQSIPEAEAIVRKFVHEALELLAQEGEAIAADLEDLDE